MNKIKRERFEIIRGTIVLSLTISIFYLIIGMIILALIGIVSSEFANSIESNEIFSIIFTFIVFTISTICAILLYFKNKDLEDEVGKDIVKYSALLFITIAIIVALVSLIRANSNIDASINDFNNEYENEISLEFLTMVNELKTYGQSTKNQNLLYMGIKLLSRFITVFVAELWIGKEIVGNILPEEV